MDHVAEKTNIRDGLGLPLCKETISSASPLKHKGKIQEEGGGEKGTRGWRSWSSQLLEAGMLEDGQETRTGVK